MTNNPVIKINNKLCINKMVSYESIYPGATYLLDPGYQFTGYRVRVGDMGATTSIQTANQLKEVNNLLNQGMKTTEISLINPEVFEMIPNNMFTEINRLNKLTGAESTMHAPTLDPSGFGEQGWSEEQRKAVARQLTDFVKRSHDLDPKGNIPVTIHSSVIPGSELIPESHPLVTEEEKGNRPLGRMIVVDQESGKLQNLERERLYSPTEPEGKIYTPQDRLEMTNYTKWINAIRELAYAKKQADEVLIPASANIVPLITKEGGITKEDIEKNQGSFQQMQRAKLFLDNIKTSFRNVYEGAAKYGDKETKEELKKLSEDWQKTQKLIQEKSRGIGQFEIPIIESNLIDRSIETLQRLEGHAPEVFRPVEEFAKDKASETLSQVALETFKKFGNTSPIISIENPPYGQALSSGQDLKELVLQTRGKFEDKLVKEGKSKSEASAIAEKLIGATWDTSHIAMIRKQGFDNKRLVEETKTIAPFIKHVHFNDNFGSTHTDLPPGMGSVPVKDILEVLEANKVKGKRIFEGGNFFQHFQKSPFPYTLQYSGSPIYDNHAPYFNQLGGLGNYYMGHGPVNPALHHTLYGAGFTTLPTELGGEMPGQQSRFAGAPNQ
jgi:hypothetical protein